MAKATGLGGSVAEPFRHTAAKKENMMRTRLYISKGFYELHGDDWETAWPFVADFLATCKKELGPDGLAGGEIRMVGPYFASDIVLYPWPAKVLLCTKQEYTEHIAEPDLIGPVKEIGQFEATLMVDKVTIVPKNKSNPFGQPNDGKSGFSLN